MVKNGNSKQLDELDWSIVEQLQNNARLSTAEIGRQIGLSAPAVASRIQKMEEHEIIKGYQTILDLDKVGLTIRAFIFFRPNSLKHTELIELVESIYEIKEWFTVTGNFAILLKIAASTSERLASIIEQLEEYGETNTSLILSKNCTPVIFKGMSK